MRKNKMKKAGKWRTALLITSLLIPSVVGAAAFLYGDANGDGVVNLKDVTELRRQLSAGDIELNDQNRGLDVNADGSANLKDITHLQRYLAGGWGIELPTAPEEPDTPEVPDTPALSDDLSGYEVISTSTSENQVVCTAFRYGSSTLGRDLVCWSIQQGEYSRTLLLNFEIHGWEDEYATDGQLLVDLGNALVKYFSEAADLEGCRLLIIPSCNPDGLEEGTTNNGFGRCNANGIDLNRDFDASHQVYTSARNYTTAPFSAVETQAMRDLVLASSPSVVIDFHGWENCTIGSADLAEGFSLHVGVNHKNVLTQNAHGYFSYWAQLQGAEALLVEFKNSASVVTDDVIASIEDIMSGSYGQNQSDYELDSVYGEWKDIQSYALSSEKVYVQPEVGASGTSYGYIDGGSDLCTISQIYSNGWCKVKYPAGSAGYTKTGYCRLSEFIDADTAVTPYQASVGETVKVYRTSGGDVQLGSVWSTDTFTVIAEKGGMAQIIYPLDSGGYKMGWIDAGKLKN